MDEQVAQNHAHWLAQQVAQWHLPFAGWAVGVIDFKANTFATQTFWQKKAVPAASSLAAPPIYFDLASLTKPLTFANLYAQKPTLFSPEMILLLNHQAGLPAGGRLNKQTWPAQILAYPIKKSAALYSDYSAIRLMLELEKKTKQDLLSLVKPSWDEEVKFWRELPQDAVCPPTGWRQGKVICGEVHDDNAWMLKRFTGHTGLFATATGLAQTLLGLVQKHDLLSKMMKLMQEAGEQRFVGGFDRVINTATTLAGQNSGKMVFGHLGFTGTAFWIDPELQAGHFSLTNACYYAWYDRRVLNQWRREVAQKVWGYFRELRK